MGSHGKPGGFFWESRGTSSVNRFSRHDVPFRIRGTILWRTFIQPGLYTNTANRQTENVPPSPRGDPLPRGSSSGGWTRSIPWVCRGNLDQRNLRSAEGPDAGGDMAFPTEPSTHQNKHIAHPMEPAGGD
jgi:hypothetical protein